MDTLDTTERRKRKSGGSSRHASGSSQHNNYVLQTNPLLIDTILRRFFSFVDYESLKEYRLVCHKWKEILDPMFIKQSVFASENFWKITPGQSILEPEDIGSLFMSINEDVRFTAFKFQVNWLRPCIVETYLEPNKIHMTQLEIYNISIGDSRGCEIDKLIGPNLKRLRLSKRKAVFETNPWVVSLEALSKISYIDLTDTLIVIYPGFKMAPVDLKLNLCRFRIDESHEYSTKVKAQDIIDFRNLQNLNLQNYRSCDPFISFSDCINVPHLTFMNITVNLDGKVCPSELTLKSNRYSINGHYVENQFLLNDYLAITKFHKIVIEDDRIVFDYGRTESDGMGLDAEALRNGRVFSNDSVTMIRMRQSNKAPAQDKKDSKS